MAYLTLPTCGEPYLPYLSSVLFNGMLNWPMHILALLGEPYHKAFPDKYKLRELPTYGLLLFFALFLGGIVASYVVGHLRTLHHMTKIIGKEFGVMEICVRCHEKPWV